MLLWLLVESRVAGRGVCLGWAKSPTLGLQACQGTMELLWYEHLFARFGGGFHAGLGSNSSFGRGATEPRLWGEWRCDLESDTMERLLCLRVPLLALVPLPWLWMGWRWWRSRELARQTL